MFASATLISQFIRGLFGQIYGTPKIGTLQRRLGVSILGSFGFKVTSTVLGLVSNILLARLLNLTEYGLYTYATAWPVLLSVFAALGFDRFLVRQIAVYQARSAWGLTRGLLRRANQVVSATSVCWALATVLIITLLNTSEQE